MNDDRDVLPSNVESILTKVSEELLQKKDGYCFTVEAGLEADDQEKEEYQSYKSAFSNNELAEFVNYDMLGDEGDGLESFGHLITSDNHEDLTGDRKVLKVLLDPGIGQVVPENSIVLIHYIAYISNLCEPFDVTYLQGRRPKRFTLGNGELISGLEIGIKTMTTGENARFIIHPDHAYRELGCPPRIPPNSTVLFDVYLVTYFSAETYLSFDEDSRDPKRFEKNIVQIKKIHIEGNEQFKLGNLEKAIHKYDRAKELLHIVGCNSDKEEIEMMKYLNKLYSNLSLCYLKQCAFNKVCRMGIEAMKYSERFSKNHAKLFYNWGKALRLLKDFSEAKKKLHRALSIEPRNESIIYELERLEKDRVFNSNVESFTMTQDDNDDDKCMPQAFWEVFDTHLTQFVNGSDDILTVKLNKNPDDVELMKRKACSYNLQCQVVTKAGVETDCIAINKIRQ